MQAAPLRELCEQGSELSEGLKESETLMQINHVYLLQQIYELLSLDIFLPIITLV